MSELKAKLDSKKKAEAAGAVKAKPQGKQDWETPKMEDVSGQVMAQPYIRFT